MHDVNGQFNLIRQLISHLFTSSPAISSHIHSLQPMRIDSIAPELLN